MDVIDELPKNVVYGKAEIDEILNDIMRYASSSTKVSSQFIKI